MDVLQPANVDEVASAVTSAPQVLAVGGGTKPRLSKVACVNISMQRISGIVEYEPGEFTITALAGTPVGELKTALAASGQYLPFDPVLVDAGATLGGTASAGINGPGRFRFGGMRDFVLGVQWVDGSGRLLRAGGRVVKNAAGFDVPKFMVGALGRFGVLTELTFKVFPRAPETLTIKLPVETVEAAIERLTTLARSRWEPDALDYLPAERAVFLRLCGPLAGIEPIAEEVSAEWGGATIAAGEAEKLWTDLREFRWAQDAAVVAKVVHTPTQLPEVCALAARTGGASMHTSCGGNVSYVALAEASAVRSLYAAIAAAGFRAVTLRGDAPLWCGNPERTNISRAVKAAMDAQKRFPDLDD